MVTVVVDAHVGRVDVLRTKFVSRTRARSGLLCEPLKRHFTTFWTAPERSMTMRLVLLLLAVCACSAKNPTDPKGSCGTKPTPIDCEHVDFGTCGARANVSLLELIILHVISVCQAMRAAR